MTPRIGLYALNGMGNGVLEAIKPAVDEDLSARLAQQAKRIEELEGENRWLRERCKVIEDGLARVELLPRAASEGVTK